MHLQDRFWLNTSCVRYLLPDMETETASKLLNKNGVGPPVVVSLRTVDNWMKDGILPYLKLGPKCVRFDPTECDKAIARFQVRAKNQTRA